MRWHKPNITPDTENKDSHLIIKTLDSDYRWVTYDKDTQQFTGFCGTTIFHYKPDQIDSWCYVEEDDCVTDEMLALSAIQDAMKHAQSLYDILLTDGICCGEKYRELVGLNELESIQNKLTRRILYLEDMDKAKYVKCSNCCKIIHIGEPVVLSEDNTAAVFCCQNCFQEWYGYRESKLDPYIQDKLDWHIEED